MEIEVEFYMDVPDNTPADDVDAWLDFKLGVNGQIKTSILQALGDDIEARSVSWRVL